MTGEVGGNKGRDVGEVIEIEEMGSGVIEVKRGVWK